MPADLERRFSPGECRADATDDKRIRGMAIVFDSMSVSLGGFREIIKPEAVDRTLREALDVRALADHDTGKVLARTKSGTLQLRKEKRGLAVVIDADPEISYAKDVMRAVARGDVSGMSFGFRVLDDEWDEDENGMPVRYVTDMRVSEVSIVAFPAYESTDAIVSQRSLTALQEFQAARPGARSLDMLRRVHRSRLARG
jgi:HK97 family phage prohead protease